MKKVFLDNLPRWRYGKFKLNGEIDWKQSGGNFIHFIHGETEGDIEIINYKKIKGHNPKLLIKYNNKEYKISPGHLKNCEIERILEKRTPEFKIEIGTIFEDTKRDITIINSTKIQDKNGQWKKYYKYHCNKCGFNCEKHYSIKDKIYKDEHWIEESNLLHGKGCSCCCSNPQIVVEGINDITTTAPWLIPYFQGGYDEAKRYTCNSGQKIRPICPVCGRIKDKEIGVGEIYIKQSIGCLCSDNIPYPEKIMFSVLEQLNLEFQTQLSKITYTWCDKYRYDFYFELNGERYICEVNGIQHYKEKTGSWTMNLSEIELNDKLKKKLALTNGIKKENYIVIDCRYSTLEYIKQNILKHKKLNKLFDLSIIDWNNVEKFALSNLVKIACDYKRDNPFSTTGDIGKIMGYHTVTISAWLKKGNMLGWCNYLIKEGCDGKITAMFKKDVLLGVFISVREITKKSNKLFNIELKEASIYRNCNKRIERYKGYTFKYIEDLTQEEYIKYDIENKLKELHSKELVQAC